MEKKKNIYNNRKCREILLKTILQFVSIAYSSPFFTYY